MSEASGNKFWKTLNAPIVIAVVVLAVWPFISTFAAALSAKWVMKRALSPLASMLPEVGSRLRDTFEFRDKAEARALPEFREVKKLLVIDEVKLAPSRYAARDVVIGKITNKAAKTVREIRLQALLYGEDGKLIDVKDWLLQARYLEPNETVGFRIERFLGGPREGPEAEAPKPAKAEVQVTGFTVVKEERKEDGQEE